MGPASSAKGGVFAGKVTLFTTPHGMAAGTVSVIGIILMANDCLLTPADREKYAMLFAMGVVPSRCGKNRVGLAEGCVLPSGHKGPCGSCGGNRNNECLDRAFNGAYNPRKNHPWCY